MGMTLWIDSDAEETVELGGTLAALHAFAELATAAGGDAAWVGDWPALSGVTNQCETQEDADPEWLAEVREEAARFRGEHADALSAEAVDILDALAGSEGGAGDPPETFRSRFVPG